MCKIKTIVVQNIYKLRPRLFSVKKKELALQETIHELKHIPAANMSNFYSDQIVRSKVRKL